MQTNKNRCHWVKDDLDIDYHDREWGVLNTDDQYLFEMLILEGMQAGLSWNTILKKRQELKKVFLNFDYKKCAIMTDEYLEKQLENKNIIRNRLKIYGVRKNAIAYIEVQKEWGSFYNYIWNLIGQQKINNTNIETKDIPTKTELSDKISRDMKKRGFTFVGSTIIYSYLQAIGIINDHLVGCYRYTDCL